MNSIRVNDDFTVTLFLDRTYRRAAYGIDRDDEPSGFAARIILPEAVNSKLSFF
jgi:hypothetical protein